MTKADLIADALKALGVLGENQPIDANDQALANRMLNRMIGDWANQGLTMHAFSINEFTLTSGTQTYTVGPGATWATQRPIGSKLSGWAVIPDTSLGVTEKVRIPRGRPWKLHEWESIPVQGYQSSLPWALYIDGTYDADGRTTAKVFPVPDQDNIGIVLYQPTKIGEFTGSYSADVVLPEGYELALMSNLSILCAPFFTGARVSPALERMAQNSLNNIKHTNWDKHEPQRFNDAPWTVGEYNIYTDEFGR